jgi:hypothetical protein
MRFAPRGGRAALVAAAWLAASMFAAPGAFAEPYLAVRAGLKCTTCHVNPTGGGKRNEFGSVYGQTVLPARRVDANLRTVPSGASEPAPWTGRIGEHFAIGGDLRKNYTRRRQPNTPETSGFDPARAQLYLEARLLGDNLVAYLDEHVSPDAATTREAFALLWLDERRYYVKAGRLYVPFGLRVEDDTAFVRLFSGTTFASFDDGIEGGLEIGPWSAALSVTNGAGGGVENNSGKLVSALGVYVQPGWRIGISASHNGAGDADRNMQSIFGGLRTGPVAWLASAVRIEDPGNSGGRVRRIATLLEGNVEFAKGHNLKLTYEYYDPNRSVRENHRVRYSAVWEYTPFQFTQLRLGARKNDGIPQNDAQNANEVFAQWHAYF